MLITHDLGVVAEMVDDVIVMYAGQIVEQGTVDEVLLEPRRRTRWACSSRSRPSRSAAGGCRRSRAPSRRRSTCRRRAASSRAAPTPGTRAGRWPPELYPVGAQRTRDRAATCTSPPRPSACQAAIDQHEQNMTTGRAYGGPPRGTGPHDDRGRGGADRRSRSSAASSGAARRPRSATGGPSCSASPATASPGCSRSALGVIIGVKGALGLFIPFALVVVPLIAMLYGITRLTRNRQIWSWAIAVGVGLLLSVISVYLIVTMQSRTSDANAIFFLQLLITPIAGVRGGLGLALRPGPGLVQRRARTPAAGRGIRRPADHGAADRRARRGGDADVRQQRTRARRLRAPGSAPTCSTSCWSGDRWPRP